MTRYEWTLALQGAELLARDATRAASAAAQETHEAKRCEKIAVDRASLTYLESTCDRRADTAALEALRFMRHEIDWHALDAVLDELEVSLRGHEASGTVR